MLEQFRQYEIKNTKSIFGRDDLENQFTSDCEALSRPLHYPNDMPFCFPTLNHADPTSADGYFGRDHGN